GPREPCGASTHAPASNWKVSVLCSLVLNLHQMMHARDHAANGRRILALHHLVHAAEAQSTHRLAHVSRAADEAAYPLDSKSFRLGSHDRSDAPLRRRGSLLRRLLARFSDFGRVL